VTVTSVRLRDFRSYPSAEAALGAGLTVVHGTNGAGKTNLLEALYFGCTARSFRTTNERELIRFECSTTRVEVDFAARDGAHTLAVGFKPGEAKRLTLDGAPLARLLDDARRPLVSVFSPDRLELIKGGPHLRRAHLDQLVAALWPARAQTRRRYGEALAQRNALLIRVRGGRAGADALRAWDLELGRVGIDLIANRAHAAELLDEPFAEHAAALGLEGAARVAYRPRSRATTPEALAEEIAAALDSDLAHGYTTFGPHRDELVFRRAGRNLRSYGSQGEQRITLLALILAERDALAQTGDRTPLLLLDDVMSELDARRREHLAQRISAPGQAVVSATELAHVPGAGRSDVAEIAVASLRGAPA
jgi:DNA replication and repair protein RecF